eukprot:scaffold32982_cov57-Phaeocystis_antarctica.AAC.4
MKAALGKIARIERYAYSLEWNKFGAIFYGGLKRQLTLTLALIPTLTCTPGPNQVELTKERKASPPDAAWPAFEYGNPGSFRRGLGTLPDAISAALGQPVGSPPQPDARVRLQWKLSTLERE